MSSAEQVFHLLEQLEKNEEEFKRLVPEPTQESIDGPEEQVRQLKEQLSQIMLLSTERRCIFHQLKHEIGQWSRFQQSSFFGEHRLLTELHTISHRLDRLSEDSTCSICLLPWSADDGHQLVALRCGHLFGKNCIHAAIRRFHRCPICRRRAQHADVRRIYGRSSMTL
ncbi:E3 ubiquitin-protein ligase rnf8-A [Drosophila biarmipes]|uniref:E3 ubiquitin-protein ligase rnf8-A n=1 Tax=Drosophila biarmipes TaxID=125945 RepID=UPI0007E65207|nr:E3 ubiquitin-protein ligase rnf8-A [Drosophila biarmipes]